MILLHNLDTMTVKRYAQFERDRDIKKLFRVPVPQFIAVKYAPRFVAEFNRVFNGKKSQDNEKELERIAAHNKIMMMQAILMGLQLHLGEKIQIDLIKNGGKPIVSEDAQLEKYRDFAKECTGFEINSPEDVIAFRDELERKIHKYNEKFKEPEQPEAKEGIGIIQLATGICSLLSVNLNTGISLYELSEMKKVADDKAKAMQESINKTRDGRD